MPNLYAHEKLAKEAAAQLQGEACRVAFTEYPAYLMGASGPDLLFYHYIWKGGDSCGLPQLGGELHRKHTVGFLSSLLDHAGNDAQLAYALGFVCHYALDHTLHPYVSAQCAPDGLFPMPGGHGFIEVAIDQAFYLREAALPGGTQAPLESTGPYQLTASQEESLCALLSQCVGQVYGKIYPPSVYRQALRHMRLIQRALFRPGAVKRGFLWLAERALGLKGMVTSHLYGPRLPACDFMNLEGRPWRDPAEPGRERSESVDQLFALALERANKYIGLAWSYRRREISREQLAEGLGRRSYESDAPGSGQ